VTCPAPTSAKWSSPTPPPRSCTAQASQAVDVVADVFGLTAGETRLLLGARRGEGLLLSGTQRVSFQAVASKKEHRLCIGDLELADDD
jgi:hypothetical protein